MDSILDLKDLTIPKGSKEKIEVKVVDENRTPLSGRLVLKINQSTILNGKVKNGVFSQEFDFSKLKVGEYELTVIFAGTEEADPAYKTTTLTITKAHANIELEDLVVKKGTKNLIESKITDIDGNPLNTKVFVKLNDKSVVEGEVVDGVFSHEYDFSNLELDEYKFALVVGENKLSKRTEKVVKLSLLKPKTKIELNDMIIVKGTKNLIEAKITDQEDNPITGRVAVKLNNLTVIESEVKDGVFSQEYDFKGLNDKSYELEMVLGETFKYHGANKKVTVRVETPQTIDVDINELQNACYRLTKWISINKRMPGKIAIKDKHYTITNLLYIMAKYIKNINDNNKESFDIINFDSTKVSSEGIKKTSKFSKEDYLKVIDEVIAYMDENKTSPAYIETSEGKIGYMNLIYTTCTIIANSSSENLLSSVYIRPWKNIIA